MAIKFELIAAKGTVRLSGARADAFELPPIKVWKGAAAAEIDIDVDAEIFLFRNKGDAVHVRLNVDADNTQASAGDPFSIELASGEELPFGLPADTNSQAYSLDVRAA